MSEMLDGERLYEAYAELEAKYEQYKNRTDRDIRNLIDENERHIAAETHMLATIDRLRWALSLCRKTMTEEQWTEEIQRFAESR